MFIKRNIKCIVKPGKGKVNLLTFFFLKVFQLCLFGLFLSSDII